MTNTIYFRPDSEEDTENDDPSPEPETTRVNCFGYSVPSSSSIKTSTKKEEDRVEEIECKKCKKIFGVIDNGNQYQNQKKIENNQESSPFLLRRRTNLRVSKNVPNSLHGEQVAAGWPIWLVSVASEALYGWTPRAAHTFEMLHQISWGARSTECKAKDNLTSKIAALKKVRIDRSDSVSLRSMVRHLIILRRLDHHPNVIKLEGLVVSSKNKKCYILHLVFEHMEHDLSELAPSGGTKLTETQVKSYMLQLLSGLEHCHSLGILHRNLNGSNLLLDNKGILKIAGFGSASFFDPNNKKPMSNRVANLWYRAPELILGATDYGVGIDLWSAGCILGELLIGEPIMTGSTQVEQLHQIFKLCGSPSEAYWRTANLLHKSLFMPQYPYKRCIVQTFKNCSPASLQLMEILLAIDQFERQTATALLKIEFLSDRPSLKHSEA